MPWAPPTFRKATSPSFVTANTAQLSLAYASAGSMESGWTVTTLSVPPLCSMPLAPTVTYVPPGDDTASLGGFPRGIDFTTVTLEGSTRDIVASPEFATHTASSPAATPVGARPTAVVPMTAPERGSILETVPSARFVTQSASRPTPIAAGSTPTPISSTIRPESGSRATTFAEGGETTQTRPKPTAIDDAPGAAG